MKGASLLSRETYDMHVPCVPQISVELAEMGKESRTEALRQRLREVQAQFLPSRAIYLPVGRRRHRVYRIAVEVWVGVCCNSLW